MYRRAEPSQAKRNSRKYIVYKYLYTGVPNTARVYAITQNKMKIASYN